MFENEGNMGICPGLAKHHTFSKKTCILFAIGPDGHNSLQNAL